MKKIIEKIEKIREEVEAVAYEIDNKKPLHGFVETEEQEQFYGLAGNAFDCIWGAITVLNTVEEYLLTAVEYEEKEEEEEEDDE